MKIGFVILIDDMSYDTITYTKMDDERGHIEIARRIIREIGLEKRYKDSKWGKMDNPVDYLVYEEGAIKIGNRWGAKIITYCPDSISRKIYPKLQEYIDDWYQVDEVNRPIL